MSPLVVFSQLRECQRANLCWCEVLGGASPFYPNFYPARRPDLGLMWNRIWARAVTDSGIPFKPTAYQVRHTHASWLIDAGENPKAVMHRLGQADLRTTARYVHVLDETGESAARRFEGLLPPL